MRRREFVAGVVATTLLPSCLHAQRPETTRRVEILIAEAIEDDPYYESRLTAIKERLREIGWIEGANLRLTIHRIAPKATDIRKQINETVAGQPDVIITSGGTVAGPLLQATNTIPVVFIAAVDPVGAGLVESLAHPGGNATGFMQFDYSLSGKWLELLKQVAPAVTRAGIIRDSRVTSGIGQFAVIQSVATPLRIDVVPISAREERDVESGIVKIARAPNVGLITTSGAAVSGHRDYIIKLAAQHGLPAVHAHRTWVEHGGLISYGPDLLATARLGAGYVDRILKGEKPAELPVQAPTKYEMVINLKTAKARNLTVLPTLLARADEVIE
jgi:putative tryptophan/tyrosine transport system substrate-binding protein